MKNEIIPYDLAIKKLKGLKGTYSMVAQYRDLKNHSLVIVNNFGSDWLKDKFRRLTTFDLHTDETIRLQRTQQAIDVAINDFELKQTSIEYGAIYNGMNDDSSIKESLTRVFLYIITILLILSSIIIANNWNGIILFEFNTIQKGCLISIVLIFALNFIKKYVDAALLAIIVAVLTTLFGVWLSKL